MKTIIGSNVLLQKVSCVIISYNRSIDHQVYSIQFPRPYFKHPRSAAAFWT